jgi:hypothetical protein
MSAPAAAPLQVREYNLSRVPDAAPPPTVYIDEQRRLIVNGTPTFVVGMYAGAMGEPDFDRFGSSNFTAVMPYHQLNATQMDWAATHGVRVAYSIKDDFCNHSLQCPNASSEETVVKARLRAFRDHPALLIWYTNDELGPEWSDQLRAHQAWVEELDPNHPTWAVIYQVGEMGLYQDFEDVIGSDPYPIPQHPASMVGQWTEDTVEGTASTKAVVEVIQAHNLKDYWPAKPGRTPTAAESRCMAWQAVAAGANGIFVYSYFDIQRNPDVPFEAKWEELNALAGELRRFAPLLLSDEGAAPAITVDGGRPAWLRTRERWATSAALPAGLSARLGGGGERVYAVFAVSTSNASAALTFRLPQSVGRAASVGVANEAPPRPIAPAAGGAAWQDSMPPLGVRVYVATLV